MKKDNRINPIGIKGNEINERMKELMGIKPINENHSTSVVELTKIGPDGNAYAIVRENHEYYIKTTIKKDNLVGEDFKYIGGLQNKKSEAYPSYAKAIKHLNLKFNSLAESFDKGHNINVFENDNLLAENGLAGGFSDHPKGGGFTGEGNLEGNTPLPMKEEEEEEDVELTEAEAAIEEMCDDVKTPGKYKGGAKDKAGVDYDGDGVPNGADKDPKDGLVSEHKLSIARALQQMDSIIDTLAEGKVKKKVYTIK